MLILNMTFLAWLSTALVVVVLAALIKYLIMLACVLFKVIYLSIMKMCILLGLESNYILQTKVGNLKFKFQQHIKNL